MGMRGSWSSMSISTSSPGLSKLTSSVGGAVSRPERGLPQGLSPPEPQDSALGLATLFTPCLPLPPTHPSLSRLPSLSPSPQFSLWLPPHPTDPCISLSLGLFCTTPHLSIDPPTSPGGPSPGPDDALRETRPHPSFRSSHSGPGKRRASGRVSAGKSTCPSPLCLPAPCQQPLPYLGRPVGTDSPLSKGRTGSSPGSGWYTGPPQAGGQTGDYQLP